MMKTTIHRRLLVLFLGITITSHVLSQQLDSLSRITETITNQIENLTRNNNNPQDYSDLTGDYLYYYQHPININSSQTEKLLQMHLLNEMQLTSLRNYIHQYGYILSIYELKYIPGWNTYTLQHILPFIKTGVPEKNISFSLKKIWPYSQHKLLLRYGQVIEKEEGYRLPIDSAIAHPGSVFLGSPQQLYLRYEFRSLDKIRCGFTAEKDAGELLFPHHLPDTIKSILKNKGPSFPDFFSAFLYLQNLHFIKKVIIGDYHLEFGQGLCLWSGLTFGKSSEATAIRYYGAGIKPNTSSNENRFFRGAAMTMGFSRLAITLFYSHNKVDGTYFILGNHEEAISSLENTGEHRTLNELQNKDRLVTEAFGGHVEYQGKQWNTGFTWYTTRLSLPLQPAIALYRLFSFRGKQITNMGLNASYRKNRIFFYGEIAANPDGALAGMAAIDAYPSDRVSITLAYRNFSPGYHVIYASPFMESDHVNNEQGFYVGTEILFSQWLSFSAYADYFRFPWIKYQINAPSTVDAFLLQLNIHPAKPVSMYVRFRYTQRNENLRAPSDYLTKLTTKKLTDFRYALTSTLSENLILKTRLEFIRYQKAQQTENGWLIYQDIQYQPKKLPLIFSFRYALFDTDGWNSRIYAYENDVLYAFSIPAYYDKGQRVYLLLHYKMFKHIDFWLKTSRTLFFNKTSISSGPETIAKNHKTFVRAQLQLKF